MTWFEPSGQGWGQLLDLVIALVLCSLIGVERQVKQKSAGLRTHTLVGLGAALFMLVSKYGFTDVLAEGQVVLDPSRVAAQIVSGIGFIGGGLIFVRRDMVRGLTTAAVVWVSAAVGSAAGAGLPILAVFVTAAHFLVVYAYPPLTRLLTSGQPASTVVRVRYADSRGVLRVVLGMATNAGFTIGELNTYRDAEALRGGVEVRMRLTGTSPVHQLVGALSEVEGVYSVRTEDRDDDTDEDEEGDSD